MFNKFGYNYDMIKRMYFPYSNITDSINIITQCMDINITLNVNGEILKVKSLFTNKRKFDLSYNSNKLFVKYKI